MTEVCMCELCGEDLQGKESIDLWALRTIFDENGEARKTGEESGFKNDYIVIGLDCCGKKAEAAWADMVSKL